MFWKMTGLSTTSPIDSILDKSGYTLEELLDDDQIIQECKSANSRLINYLQGKGQVQQMIHYVIDEAPEGADSKRTFKFPFISCQIFTCEIEDILKTLVEEDELLSLLFSFLDPNRQHGTLLAGYFSKAVICLLIRKHVSFMRYLQAHQEILKMLVDLIGIYSIKEVLMRLVGADDHVYHTDSLQWLADTNLLEMLVDKLSPQNSSEVHANAAETLAAITRTAPSSLAAKLASPRFVAKLFSHALEDPESKSALIHSLSVCISLLDPKRATSAAGAMRSQQPLDGWSTATADPETVDGMLQSLGDLLRLLDVSLDENKLPTTYGELRPPFGIHRLKIVEFIAVLLRTNSDAVRQELIRLQALQIVLGFFFDYPFNNMLHNYVEAIITSCIDNGSLLIDNLFQDCDFISRLLAVEDNPWAPDTRVESSASKKKPPLRVGNMGHLTRIANRLLQAATNNSRIHNYLQSHPRWNQWQTTVLQQRNILENVFQWTCGRPTAIRERPVESDDEEFRDRDYDVSTMASNLTREVFRYGMFDNEDAEELPGTIGRDDEDVFFDDETAEVVISSIRLSDEQERFGDRNPSAWFAFQDVAPENLVPSRVDNGEINVSSPSSSSSDDEVVVGEDNDLLDTGTSSNAGSRSDSRDGVGVTPNSATGFSSDGLTDNASFNLDYFSKSSDWASFQDYEISEGTIRKEDFGENNPFSVNFDPSRELSVIADQGARFQEQSELKACMDAPLLPDSHADELVGVEAEGTAKAMESALKEGIVGEAGPLKPTPTTSETTHETDQGDKLGAQEFNDVNYWRSDYENSVAEEQS